MLVPSCQTTATSPPCQENHPDTFSASIDDVILHREDAGADGSYENTWYHLTDVQYSTVAMLDSSGGLVERVTYDAYGQARHHYRSDIDGDGDVDSADATAMSASLNKSIGDAAYNVDADIDRSGTVDSADLGTIIGALPQTIPIRNAFTTRTTPATRLEPARSSRFCATLTTMTMTSVNNPEIR